MLELESVIPEKIELELKDYPILISPSLYEFFLANRKKGLEALLLYVHLQYTARRQKTNQVWANESYLSNGLCFGTRKIAVLKAFLNKAGLIEYINYRDKEGKLKKWYIRLPYIHRRETVDRLTSGAISAEKSSGAVTAGAENHSSGYNRQMLKVNNRNA